jgi:hypothetical protein
MIVNKKSFNYRLTHFFFGEDGKSILATDYLTFLFISYIFLLLIISCLFPLPIVTIFKIESEVMLNLMVVSSVCWIACIVYSIFSFLKYMSKKIKSINVIFKD